MQTSTSTSVITGGSGAIGSAIVRNLASQGHRVFNLSLEQPTEELPATTIIVDLTDRAATASVLDRIRAECTVDNVINNAGLGYVTDIEGMSLDRVQTQFDVHNRASLQLIQAFVPGMKQKGCGRIVSIGSRLILGSRQRVIYSMVKAGLLGMSRSLSLDLARHGITVNMVSPGPIETVLFRRANPVGTPHGDKLVSAIPAGRIGTPDDVANAVGFFLDSKAGFVTGQNLYVCGGLSVGSAVV